jgi:DNA-binding response OmpR family regulator
MQVPVRILVADPSPTSCQQTANQFLGRPGVEVVQAQRGPAALAALRDDDVQIAIIDQNLAGLDGEAVYRWSHEQGRRGLLLISAMRLQDRWPAISANVRAYDTVLKPIRRPRADTILETYRRLQRPCRALLADSTIATSRMIVGLLQQSRFEFVVEEVASGRDALRFAQLEPFDVALVTIQLEDMPGPEIASRLADRADGPRVVLIGNPTDRATMSEGALAAFGAHAYLRKPFAAHELDAALHTAFGLWRPYLAKALGTLSVAEMA